MAMGRSFAAALAGTGFLAAGFGLGWLAGAGAGSRVERVFVPGPAPAPAPASPPAVVIAGATSRPDRTTMEDPARDPSPAVATLREALDALPPPEVPEGTGVLTGAVLTEEGSPLEGVAVTADPERPAPERPAGSPSTPFDEQDTTEVIAAYADSIRWMRAARRTATTGTDGAFRIEGVIDAAHRLQARKRGWQIRARDWNVASQARPGDKVGFVASPSIEVLVEITFSDGTAPPNALVRFRQETGQGTDSHSSSWMPSNRTVQAKPGTWEVSVTSGRDRDLTADPQTASFVAGEEPPTLRFTLRGRPGIRGRVTFPEGEAGGRPRVFLVRRAGSDPVDPALVRSGQSADLHERNGLYEYAFSDLVPGRYALGLARSDRGDVLAVEEATVGDGPVDLDLRMPPAQPEEFVVVRVLDGCGEPVPGVRFSTGYRSPNSASSGGSTVVARPDGSWWVFHHENPHAEHPEGVYTVTVTVANLGTETVEYRKGERREFTIRFQDPGVVVARVAGYSGSRFAGRIQLALQTRGEEPGRFFFRGDRDGLDAEGTRTFQGIQPGEYDLVVAVAFDRMSLPVSRVPVTVRPGPNEFEASLPALHRVTVEGAEGRLFLRAAGERGGSMIFQNAGADGRAVFDGIPEGEFSVQCGREAKTIRVPAETTVRF